MQQPLEEGGKSFKIAMQRMAERFVMIKSPETYTKTIVLFFEIAQPEGVESPNLEDQTTEQLKRLCWELCMEAINRDFCSYVSTGDSGLVGRKIYQSLKESE